MVRFGLTLCILVQLMVVLSGCEPPQVRNVDAGPDRTIRLGETALLTGTAELLTSSDTGTLVFSWSVNSQPEGSNAGLMNADQAMASITPDTLGEYELLLDVTVAAGTADSDTITITVISPFVTVPNVVGQDVEQALANLEDAGLQRGTLTEVSSETVAAGTIIAQDPAADSEVAPGSSVNLTVSTGTAFATVPNIVGLGEEVAVVALEVEGLVAGSITEANSDTVAAGNVISQNPLAGTVVALNSAVDFVVSLGPSPQVEVPDVVGMMEDAARARLEDLELLVEVVYEADASLADGTVRGQDPVGGTNVNRGSTVTLTVVLATLDFAESAHYDLLALKEDFLRANVLGLMSAAFDRVYGVVFVAGFHTPHVGVFDADTDAFVATIDTGIVGNRGKYLTSVPDLGALLVHTDAPTTLERIDVSTGMVTASASLAFPVVGQPQYDAVRGEFHVTTSGSVEALDAATLSVSRRTLEGISFAGDVVFNAIDDELYVLTNSESVTEGQIKVLDPDTQMVTEFVAIDMPGAALDTPLQLFWDGAEESFVVLTMNGYGAYRRDGTARRTVSFPEDGLIRAFGQYDGPNQLLVLTATEAPPVEELLGVGSRLITYRVFDGVTTIANNIALAARAGQFVVAPEVNRVYVPDGNVGVLLGVPTDPYGDAMEFRVGQSVDELALSVAGGTVFGTNTKGGSYTFALNLLTSAFEMYMGGLRPSGLVAYDSGNGENVAVLNDWDGSVTTMPMNGGAANTVAVSPRGSTNRAPQLAIDAVNNRAFLAYPEFATVSVLDLGSGESVASVAIPDATPGDVGDGAGQLQVLFETGGANRLHVLDTLNGRWHRFDGAMDFALLGTVDLSNALMNLQGGFATPRHWMHHDTTSGVFYVGPWAYNPVDGVAVNAKLPENGVLIGRDARMNLYWVSVIRNVAEGRAEVLLAVDADTQQIRAERILSLLTGEAPVYALDAENRLIVRGQKDTATLIVYQY